MKSAEVTHMDRFRDLSKRLEGRQNGHVAIRRFCVILGSIGRSTASKICPVILFSLCWSGLCRSTVLALWTPHVKERNWPTGAYLEATGTWWKRSKPYLQRSAWRIWMFAWKRLYTISGLLVSVIKSLFYPFGESTLGEESPMPATWEP